MVKETSMSREDKIGWSWLISVVIVTLIIIYLFVAAAIKLSI